MPAKKAPKAPEPKETPAATVPEPHSAVVGGIAISDKDAAVLSGDIDSRMKALLKDHQAMGARPK